MTWAFQQSADLVVVVGSAAGVQAGQEALGLLLDAGGSGHGEQLGGQVEGGRFVSLLWGGHTPRHGGVRV